MSIIKKYDTRLRKKIALRAVWLPGTYIKVGDILRLKNDAFVSVGNLKDYDISFSEKIIAEDHSIKIQSQGVSCTLSQNKANINVSKLATEIEADLKISFNAENSYFIRIPKLQGMGLDQALMVSHKIAEIPNWDFRKNYIVHKIWIADDFVFLGSTKKGINLTFTGKGEAIKNLLDNGISSNTSVKGQNELGFEILGKSGPIVMQVFRVKRDGDFY